MRVLEIISVLGRGGAETMLLGLTRELVTHGDTVECVFLTGSDVRASDLQEAGATVTKVPFRFALDPRGIVRLRSRVRAFRPDVIHTQLAGADVAGRIVGRHLGVPVVTTLQNVASHYFRARVGLRETLLRRVAHRDWGPMVACGREVAHTFGELGLRGIDLRVIPNSVAIPEASDRLPAPADLPSGVPIVLTTARLVPQKALHVLVEAAAMVLREMPWVVFVVAGGGPLREALTAQARGLGIADPFRLLGPRDDVAALLRAADLFALSSDYEGLPLALLEAMAAGVPAVATAVGDNPHVLADGCGLLVPPRRPDLLAAAIRQGLCDRDGARAMATAARERVAARYGAPAMAAAYRAVFEERVAGRQAAAH